MDREAWIGLARGVGLVLVAIIVGIAVASMGAIIGVVVASVALAVATAPLRSRLSRRLPGGLATALCAVITIVVVTAVSVATTRVLSTSGQRLAASVGDRVDALRPGTFPRRIADELRLTQAIDTAAERLPTAVVTGEDTTLAAVRRLVDLVVVAVLAAFLQSSAATSLDWWASQWPREARSRIRDWANDARARTSQVALWSVVLAATTGTAVAALAWAVGIDVPFLVAGWAAFWLIAPWVGAWIGLAPLVVVATLDGTWSGLAAAIGAVAIGLLAGELRRRTVERHVRLGATATLLAMASGVAVGGTVGALIAILVATFLVAVHRSTHRADEQPSVVPGEPRRSPAAEVFTVRPSLDGTGSQVTLAPTWRGAGWVLLGVAVGVLSWQVFDRLGRVAVWVVLAFLVAVAADRPVAFLQRRAQLRRPTAIGAVSIVALSLCTAALVLGVVAGARTTGDLVVDLPEVVRDFEDLPLVGGWLREQDVAGQTARQVDNLPRLFEGVESADVVLPAVGARLIDLFAVMALSAAFLSDGGRLVAAAIRAVPAGARRQTDRLVSVGHRAIAGYLGGAVLVATINATVVLVLGVVLGIALAPVLAVWAFLWNFVPQIGGFMGGMPLVILALAEGPWQALIAGLVFLTYQLIENHIIQPAVIAASIEVPAWVALLAALAGGAAAGLLGAIVLTPLVGVAHLMRRELRRDDFPGATVRM